MQKMIFYYRAGIGDQRIPVGMGVMMDPARQRHSELMQRPYNLTASISKKKKEQDGIEPMA